MRHLTSDVSFPFSSIFNEEFKDSRFQMELEAQVDKERSPGILIFLLRGYSDERTVKQKLFIRSFIIVKIDVT